jgi:hypothetical protein
LARREAIAWEFFGNASRVKKRNSRRFPVCNLPVKLKRTHDMRMNGTISRQLIATMGLRE